jgi:hypothetical protein
VPGNVDFFCLENFVGLNDMLSPDFTVVLNVTLHIVDKEWLSEFKLGVRERHGFKINGHSSSSFDIAEFVHTSGSVVVNVEESCHGCVIFWELFTVETRVKFLIEINNVISLWSEKGVEFIVGEDGIENINFVSSWFISSISNSSDKYGGTEHKMEFPDKCL